MSRSKYSCYSYKPDLALYLYSLAFISRKFLAAFLESHEFEFPVEFSIHAKASFQSAKGIMH